MIALMGSDALLKLIPEARSPSFEMVSSAALSDSCHVFEIAFDVFASLQKA